RSALHAIWLTGRAGAFDCGRFPGPVFGLTAVSEERNSSAIEAWIAREASLAPDPFPVTAREWFDAWLVAPRARRQGWYCPHPGPAGYAGIKLPERRYPAESAE